MAPHRARTVLAALALGAAVTVSGCDGGSGSSANSPATVENSPTPSPGASTPPSDESSAPGGIARPSWCTTEALSVSLRRGDSGAGQRYASLVLTNSSAAPCRTQGWPGLQLAGPHGEDIPTEAVRDDGTPSQAVTLSPGGRATALLHWTAVPGQDDPADGRCPGPASLHVIPPDERTSKSTPWRLGEVCGGGEIDVRPLLPG